MNKRKFYLYFQSLLCTAILMLPLQSVISLSLGGEPLSRQALFAPWQRALPLLLLLLTASAAGSKMIGETSVKSPFPYRLPAKTISSILRAALLAIAILLIVSGILNGSMRDVLYKAIIVCSECIGLG